MPAVLVTAPEVAPSDAPRDHQVVDRDSAPGNLVEDEAHRVTSTAERQFQCTERLAIAVMEVGQSLRSEVEDDQLPDYEVVNGRWVCAVRRKFAGHEVARLYR